MSSRSGYKRGPYKKSDPIARFHAAYAVVGNCWLWQLHCTPKGYGQFWTGTHQEYAHIFSYTTFIGPVPDGLELDHLCRQPACVNPLHLEPVTHRVNVLRGASPCAAHAKKTHCAKGHPFSGPNVYFVGTQRRCRACNANAHRRQAAKEGRTLGLPNADKTHCPRGHAYDDRNTRRDSRGRRCRQCHRDAERHRYNQRVGKC